MLSFSQYIKQECINIGFSDCAISKATPLPVEKEVFEKWIAQAYHGKMQYLEKNLEMRFDPNLLLPGTKAIVSVLLNYFPKKKLSVANNYRIAKYAYGQDYHFVIKEMLKIVAEKCQRKYGDFQFRAFSDSAPIPDRLWAKKGGLGWIGKNTLLINEKSGSFFLIGHLFIDRELESDYAVQDDLCLDCDKCLKACPTNALFEPYQMDATKCLSYQSIENKAAEKDISPKKFRNWIFGCDICQDVCPFNKNAIPTQVEAFDPHPDLLKLNKKQWEQMKPMDFGEIFRGTPVKRAGYKGLMQNISWIKSIE